MGLACPRGDQPCGRLLHGKAEVARRRGPGAEGLARGRPGVPCPAIERLECRRRRAGRLVAAPHRFAQGLLHRSPQPRPGFRQDGTDRLLERPESIRPSGRRAFVIQDGLLVPGALEEAREGVVVSRGDRVELVVVAPGAADGQAQEGLGEDVDLVVDAADFLLADVDRGVGPLAEAEEPGADDGLVEPVGGMPAGGPSRSPATCSTTNRSYGRSRFRARIT